MVRTVLHDVATARGDSRPSDFILSNSTGQGHVQGNIQADPPWSSIDALTAFLLKHKLKLNSTFRRLKHGIKSKVKRRYRDREVLPDVLMEATPETQHSSWPRVTASSSSSESEPELEARVYDPWSEPVVDVRHPGTYALLGTRRSLFDTGMPDSFATPALVEACTSIGVQRIPIPTQDLFTYTSFRGLSEVTPSHYVTLDLSCNAHQLTNVTGNFRIVDGLNYPLICGRDFLTTQGLLILPPRPGHPIPVHGGTKKKAGKAARAEQDKIIAQSQQEAETIKRIAESFSAKGNSTQQTSQSNNTVQSSTSTTATSEASNKKTKK